MGQGYVVFLKYRQKSDKTSLRFTTLLLMTYKRHIWGNSFWCDNYMQCLPMPKITTTQLFASDLAGLFPAIGADFVVPPVSILLLVNEGCYTLSGAPPMRKHQGGLLQAVTFHIWQIFVFPRCACTKGVVYGCHVSPKR